MKVLISELRELINEVLQEVANQPPLGKISADDALRMFPEAIRELVTRVREYANENGPDDTAVLDALTEILGHPPAYAKDWVAGTDFEIQEGPDGQRYLTSSDNDIMWKHTNGYSTIPSYWWNPRSKEWQESFIDDSD